MDSPKQEGPTGSRDTPVKFIGPGYGTPCWLRGNVRRLVDDASGIEESCKITWLMSPTQQETVGIQRDLVREQKLI